MHFIYVRDAIGCIQVDLNTWPFIVHAIYLGSGHVERISYTWTCCNHVRYMLWYVFTCFRYISMQLKQPMKAMKPVQSMKPMESIQPMTPLHPMQHMKPMKPIKVLPASAPTLIARLSPHLDCPVFLTLQFHSYPLPYPLAYGIFVSELVFYVFCEKLSISLRKPRFVRQIIHRFPSVFHGCFARDHRFP